MDVPRISGTYWMCPACRAPIRFGVYLVEQKLTIWGDPEVPYLTPHAVECPAQPPYERPSWGAGPYSTDD